MHPSIEWLPRDLRGRRVVQFAEWPEDFDSFSFVRLEPQSVTERVIHFEDYAFEDRLVRVALDEDQHGRFALLISGTENCRSEADRYMVCLRALSAWPPPS